MNEHMPECPVEKRLRAGRTVGSQTCICGALRTCEARVLDGALEQGYANGKSHGLIDGYEAGYADAALDAAEEWQRGVTAGRVLGYADGLDAAREAVAALDHSPRCELTWGCECSESHPIECSCNRDDALSAIDALREKS